MCIKNMIKITLGAAIVYCAIGVVKHVVCMITNVQSCAHDRLEDEV